MCVCVFFPSILDIKFVGRTSRGHTGGRSHRIFNPPSFCGACLDFCREKDSAIPFPRRGGILMNISPGVLLIQMCTAVGRSTLVPGFGCESVPLSDGPETILGQICKIYCGEIFPQTHRLGRRLSVSVTMRSGTS